MVVSLDLEVSSSLFRCISNQQLKNNKIDLEKEIKNIEKESKFKKIERKKIPKLKMGGAGYKQVGILIFCPFLIQLNYLRQAKL